ncbi:MAG: GNAT family N-acetyltransferase [Chloroflexia bacterium]
MIGTAQENDGPSIVAVAAATGVFSPEEVACVRSLWEESREGGESGYRFLVAREGDKVLGFACYGPHPLTRGTYDLYWLAVDPAARGRGIGRALLLAVEEEVRGRQGRLLLIETSGTPAYEPARRLYISCGYRLEAVVHDHYAPGDDLYLFSKLLVPCSSTSPPEPVHALETAPAPDERAVSTVPVGR